MAASRDEGYETIVGCPYDIAHQIRRGRMQFHIEKCRKNHLDSDAQYERCILNSNHTIPKVEMEYHLNYECDARNNWLRNRVVVDPQPCPVKDLVSVNAGSVPDSEESWDNVESNSSVLDKIKQEASTKPILRLLQCESKAKRKNFRREEVRRLDVLRSDSSSSSTSSVQGDDPPPVARKLTTNINIKRQEPTQALQTLDKVFGAQEECPTLETGSNVSAPTARAWSTVSANGRPSSTVGSYASMASSQAGPSTSYQKPATAVASADERPISAASTYGSVTSTAAAPSNQRPTIAMNIAASANRVNTNPSEEGFSTVPIPGRGRGRRINIRGVPQK